MQILSKIEQRTAKITVVGLGYVGLPLALGFAQRDFHVYGLDDDQRKIDSLTGGHDYINGQHQLVDGLIKSGKFEPVRDPNVLSQSDIIIICVPTPLTKHREPDISYVESVSARIGTLIQPGTLVVLESTTYPGTTQEVVMPLVTAHGRVSQVGKDFYLAFSPERVDPGNPSYHTYNTTKVVGGVTADCTKVTAALYATMLERADLVRQASSARAAELEKLFENIFRSVNIALVNELALMCREMDLDVWEILDLASSKPFGFMRFNPGPGIGGHCIPLDPFYLTWKAREFDFPTRFIELAGEINNRMPHHVVDLVMEGLGSKGIKGATVALLGLAYKKDVADHRESPSLRVWELLAQRGANVQYHDPMLNEVKDHGKSFKGVDWATAMAADCVILMTDHSEFDIDKLLREAKVLVDTRGVSRGRTGQAQVLQLGCPRHKIPAAELAQKA